MKWFIVLMWYTVGVEKHFYVIIFKRIPHNFVMEASQIYIVSFAPIDSVTKDNGVM
jgi:hypothetical protein